MGIGVKDLDTAWKWYRENLGFDVPIFEEEAIAELMLPYTGGKPRKRRAVLALNLNGGGGLEIWQYKDRDPQAADFTIQLGDYGINCARVRAEDVEKSYNFHSNNGVQVLTDIRLNPAGEKHYFIKDIGGNLFEIVEGPFHFGNTSSLSGGIVGAIIGCSDIDKSARFYSDILGYDKVEYEVEGVHEDLKSLEGSPEGKRMLLSHSLPVKGTFSRLLGSAEVELFQATNHAGRKIFKNRFWGDLGFIHLCFDINGIEALKTHCAMHGTPFTVDSSSDFDMGEAAGHFSYIEDPDGTLIEFVETHKIPLLKKIGWYLDLRKRKRDKPLPNWMLKMLSLNRKRP